MADDPSNGKRDKDAPTVRDLKRPALSGDTVPDLVGLYVPPRPLPELSQHRTLDLKSVRLSAHADPRQAPTELRLVSPPKPERMRSGLWIAGGVLIGVGAWFLVPKVSSSGAVAPPKAPVPSTRPAVAAPARVAIPVPSASVAPPTPPPSTAPAATPERLPAAPASAKPQRPRETSKKRKDPWLE